MDNQAATLQGHDFINEMYQFYIHPCKQHSGMGESVIIHKPHPAIHRDRIHSRRREITDTLSFEKSCCEEGRCMLVWLKQD